jgi:hypothetical protein
MNENQYWWDFANGNSLTRYGDKIVKSFIATRWQAEDVYYPNTQNKDSIDGNSPTLQGNSLRDAVR